jgi:3-hydroxypropanoate dehydrogenase
VPPNHCLFLAARALGLDGGPMSGFDNARVDAEFFPAPDGADEVNRAGRWRSNFLVNLGYGDPAQLLWGATNPIPL